MDKVKFKYNVAYVFSTLAEACAFMAEVQAADPVAYDNRMVTLHPGSGCVSIVFWSFGKA